METSCQVNCCTNAARVELTVDDGLVLDVCRKCATDDTVRAFQAGKNIGVYSYEGQRVVIACEGDPPIPREVAFESGIRRWCEAPPTWSAYMIPCSSCREEYAFDVTGQNGRVSLFCADCDPKADLEPDVAPPLTEDQAAEEAHAYAETRIQEENVSAKDETADFSKYKPPWGDEKPVWDQLPPGKMRDAAKEAYEERAAIMEYDGEQPRMVAEKDAYDEVTKKAVDAKLVTHEQLGLFG